MKPTMNFGDITEARERANKRYVSLAVASHDASVLAEAVEALLQDKGELVLEVKRLKDERAVLMEPVGDVDLEEVISALGGVEIGLTVRRDIEPDAEEPGEDFAILINGTAPMITVAGSDAFSPTCLDDLDTGDQTGAEVHDAQALALARAICKLPSLVRWVASLRAAHLDLIAEQQAALDELRSERNVARAVLEEDLSEAFAVYRQATTSALGIDPSSCAEDVQEAIRELKLTLATNAASETP